MRSFVLYAAAASALQISPSVRLPSAPRTPMLARMQVPEAPPETETTPAVAPAAEEMPAATPVAFTPPEVGSGFAGIKGAIELLAPEHPVLTKLLAKVTEEEAKTELSRAEFWTNETATVLEVINVIGRWQSHTDIRERNEFTAESYRAEDLRQSGTEKRYKMAQKMKCTERYGLMCNAPKRPFTDEKLAASVGLTCADFNELPVSMAACNIAYDALAESRTGLIPYADADARRTAWITPEGALDLGRLKFGLYKSRAVVIFAWFWFGKGNFVWILVIARTLADLRPDLFAALNPATEEGKLLWKAFAIL